MFTGKSSTPLEVSKSGARYGQQTLKEKPNGRVKGDKMQAVARNMYGANQKRRTPKNGNSKEATF